MGWIYKITNTINDKVYVGQTRYSIAHRFSQHKCAAPDSQLHQDMQLLGADNFIIDILEECSNDQLNNREMYWINYYDSFNTGYNMTLGGGGHYLNSPKVYCYTLKGNLYKIYTNSYEACEDHDIELSTLRACLTDPARTSCAGFQWAYEEDLSRIKDLSTLPEMRGQIYGTILQYNLNGEFIAEYFSMEEAAQVTQSHTSGIARCINNELKCSNNFLWRRGFKGEPYPLNIEVSAELAPTKGKRRKVQLIEGDIITTYNSLSEAARLTGVSRSAITRYCENYPKITSKGVQYRYYEE